jgi:iron(III) transport system permease protein
VISAGLLVGIDFIFDTSITFYGILGLLMCLALRFMTPAFNYISASLSNISESAENSLQTQPKNSLKAFKFFYFPQMKPAIFLSLMLVFIESIKEQPATLLLRPVGFDTLSTKIYNFTSEGQWEMAAGPSLLLVGMSLIFVYLINRHIDLDKKR